MKRRLAIIAVFLVLGAVVNVGVIWGSQFLIYDSMVYHRDSSIHEVGPTPNAWPINVPATWPEPESSRSIRTFWHDMEMHATVKRDEIPVLSLTNVSPTEMTTQWFVHQYRWGLPYRSMRCVQAAQSDMETRVDGGGLVGPININWQYREEPGLANAIRSGIEITIPSSMGIALRGNGPRTQRWTMLPLQPLPLGFTINTLFYASLLAAPVLGFATLKRRRRAKRGLCIGCGYEVTGVDVCPECGRQAHGQPRV